MVHQTIQHMKQKGCSYVFALQLCGGNLHDIANTSNE